MKCRPQAIATQVSPAPTICVLAWKAKISIASQLNIIGQPDKATRFGVFIDSAIFLFYLILW
jgi:hypothetical protein